MEHTWHNCKDENCPICQGGLFACIICGLAEGSLTTDCPGVRVSGDDQDRIYYKGDLDFRDGKWVNEPNPANQMWQKARGYREEIERQVINNEEIINKCGGRIEVVLKVPKMNDNILKKGEK